VIDVPSGPNLHVIGARDGRNGTCVTPRHGMRKIAYSLSSS
jgi:hypothetical protein